MNKKLLFIIAAILVIGGLWWLLRSGRIDNLPQLPGASPEDSTIEIQKDLEEIDLGDINKEFENIDAELNNL